MSSCCHKSHSTRAAVVSVTLFESTECSQPKRVHPLSHCFPPSSRCTVCTWVNTGSCHTFTAWSQTYVQIRSNHDDVRTLMMTSSISFNIVHKSPCVCTTCVAKKDGQNPRCYRIRQTKVCLSDKFFFANITCKFPRNGNSCVQPHIGEQFVAHQGVFGPQANYAPLAATSLQTPYIVQRQIAPPQLQQHLADEDYVSLQPPREFQSCALLRPVRDYPGDKPRAACLP